MIAGAAQHHAERRYSRSSAEAPASSGRARPPCSLNHTRWLCGQATSWCPGWR
jgi:hypothetical protein